MQTMVSLTLKTYNGKSIKPGQRFEVEDEGHVRTLILSRKAELAPEIEDSKGGRYRRRDMKADK